MSVLCAIIERLADRIDVRVCGAAELAALGTRRDKGPATSAVYVVPLEEQAPASDGVIGPARALVRAGYGVVVRVVNRRDRRGEAATEDVEALRDLVRAAIYGWEPDGASAPLLFRRGALLDAGRGEVWWQDEYETEVLITEVVPPPPFEAQTWVFDTGGAAAVSGVFGNRFDYRPGDILDGGWIAETELPGGIHITQITASGPSGNNTLPFVFSIPFGAFIEPNPSNLILTMLPDGEGREWLQRPEARRIALRCCLQGAFDGAPPEGLAVEHRADSEGEWVTAHLIRGWGYAATRDEGDEVVDAGGTTFHVAADGGWRDVTVDIPATARELRLRPIYTAPGTEALSGNIMALHSITLDVAEAG